jgi:hypothetical protein
VEIGCLPAGRQGMTACGVLADEFKIEEYLKQMPPASETARKVWHCWCRAPKKGGALPTGQAGILFRSPFFGYFFISGDSICFYLPQ